MGLLMFSPPLFLCERRSLTFEVKQRGEKLTNTVPFFVSIFLVVWKDFFLFQDHVFFTGIEMKVECLCLFVFVCLLVVLKQRKSVFSIL